MPKYRYLFHLLDIKIDNIFRIFDIFLLVIRILRTFPTGIRNHLDLS